MESKNVVCKTSAIVGLGLAYVGSHREDLSSILLPFISDDSVSMEIASLSALALGFIFVGSSNGEITSTILQALMERTEDQLDEKWARFMTLGLGLLYLGRFHDPSAWLLRESNADDFQVSKTSQMPQ